MWTLLFALLYAVVVAVEEDYTLVGCNGDFDRSMALASSRNDAAALHTQSEYLFILYGNASGAVALHREAKKRNPTLIPPLPQLHLNGNMCSGLSDIFYIAAVTIKQLVDSNLSKSVLLNGHTTFITLLSDSGFHREAEVHLRRALELAPHDTTLQMRSTLMTPGVYESLDHVHETRQLLVSRLETLRMSKEFVLTSLDEFVLAPTFYLVYQGYNDKHFLQDLHNQYARGYPQIASYPSALSRQYIEPRKLRVGFVSKHFRKHSICKLFCGIIENLDKGLFDVYAFSSVETKDEDSFTARLRKSVKYVPVRRVTLASQSEVTSRNIDILIYLDVGMDPGTTIWAASRLAPTQITVWGHPTTTGLPVMDYYISSAVYHRFSEPNANNSDSNAFSEQLVLFDSLGFSFALPFLPTSPSNDELINREDTFFASFLTSHHSSLNYVKQLKAQSARIVLCPQHLPKFHPAFDEVLLPILDISNNTYIVLLYNSRKNTMWRRTLLHRWSHYDTSRIVFVDSLSSDDYLTLLALGDVSLDPYPFGGGVTVLESLAVCTPVITYPGKQSVLQLAAGMYQKMNLMELIVHSPTQYISTAKRLLFDEEYSLATRRKICEMRSVLYNDVDGADEWSNFLKML